MDTCGWDCICAGPAFFTGLLYGNLDEALEFISKWEKKDLLNAYKDAPMKGLDTNLMGKENDESRVYLKQYFRYTAFYIVAASEYMRDDQLSGGTQLDSGRIW